MGTTSEPALPRGRRSDAQRNEQALLAAAAAVFVRSGVEAPIREIAAEAGVGIGTLYRHFPTREALLDALLRASFDDLTAQAVDLEASSAPGDALVVWLRACAAVAHEHRGVVTMMMAAIEDAGSALHASCATMHAAGGRLLARAQAAGAARADVDGTDLFALVGALAWISDQPALTPRADHLGDVIARALLTGPVGEPART